MRFSLQPEQQPEQRMRTLNIDEVLSAAGKYPDEKPQLEQYFSPTKKEQFIKNFLHYLNTRILDAKHGNLDVDLYLVFVLSFQFTAPLLEISAEKEMGLFYRVLQKNYQIEEIDMNIHFSSDQSDEGMLGEKEALKTYREELKETYDGNREIKENTQKRIKKDAIEAIMSWQQAHSLPALAEAFGRSVVIPAFFNCVNRRLITFYRETTGGITYKVAIPEEIE